MRYIERDTSRCSECSVGHLELEIVLRSLNGIYGTAVYLCICSSILNSVYKTVFHHLFKMPFGTS